MSVNKALSNISPLFDYCQLELLNWGKFSPTVDFFLQCATLLLSSHLVWLHWQTASVFHYITEVTQRRYHFFWPTLYICGQKYSIQHEMLSTPSPPFYLLFTGWTWVGLFPFVLFHHCSGQEPMRISHTGFYQPDIRELLVCQKWCMVTFCNWSLIGSNIHHLSSNAIVSLFLQVNLAIAVLSSKCSIWCTLLSRKHLLSKRLS